MTKLYNSEILINNLVEEHYDGKDMTRTDLNEEWLAHEDLDEVLCCLIKEMKDDISWIDYSAQTPVYLVQAIKTRDSEDYEILFERLLESAKRYFIDDIKMTVRIATDRLFQQYLIDNNLTADIDNQTGEGIGYKKIGSSCDV